MTSYKQCLAIIFASMVLMTTVTPAISYSLNSEDQRAFVTKQDGLKKQNLIEHKQKIIQKPSKIGKPNQDSRWGSMINGAFGMLSGNSGSLQKNDEFSWTKIVTLGIQFILNLFGMETAAIEKMDPGSPVEALMTAIIAYFSGSNDPSEVTAMAKQATELWDIVITLLDTLRTSFSQRSLHARSLGTNDLMADAAIVSTSMLKGVIRTYRTPDDGCVEKYVCEANRDCADGTTDSGYLFCQMATYAMSYMMESSTNTPFEIINDAGRRGRGGNDCAAIAPDCKSTHF